VDIARGEMVEKELDAMIERRSRKGGVDPDEREELWKESVRRYNTRRREENRIAWCEYFSRLAGSLRARAEEYDRRAQTLMKTDEPRGVA
jgi:MoaA/NifB/PqqE/SkfB family radical SAM enzyme